VFNDSDSLLRQLQRLQDYRKQGHEVIVVDGGSSDGTAEVQEGQADFFTVAERGRALQMNRGAELASGDVLLFLHADTCLPEQAIDLIAVCLQQSGAVWGRFDVRLSGRQAGFRLIEKMINLRSHLTGVVTGDQSLFVTAQAFRQIGGYPPIPLMEDVALSKLLRRLSWPARIRHKATTSSRRWEKHGTVRTILLMWWLRLLYFLGVNPEYLAKKYDHHGS
jgi:rSAM/selenodomain-associated transferase 2